MTTTVSCLSTVPDRTFCKILSGTVERQETVVVMCCGILFIITLLYIFCDISFMKHKLTYIYGPHVVIISVLTSDVINIWDTNNLTAINVLILDVLCFLYLMAKITISIVKAYDDPLPMLSVREITEEEYTPLLTARSRYSSGSQRSTTPEKTSLRINKDRKTPSPRKSSMHGSNASLST